MDKIRWGIISTGNIAAQMTTALNMMDGVEVLGVASRTRQSAEEFGDQHHIPRRYASYEALAHDPDVDVIYIGTPHMFHAENMRLCLEAGKHVLCEKAFTINAEQARECIQLARSKGLFLMEAMWMRYLPSTTRVRELVEDGMIGEVRTVRANFDIKVPFDPRGRLYDPQVGGGAMLDLGIYPISFATMLLGIPDGVSSYTDLGRTGVDENTAILFNYANGAQALLSCSMQVMAPCTALIAGTEGYIEVHDRFHHSERLTVRRGNQAPEVMEVPYEGNGYQYEAAEVNACIRAGRTESEIMPLDETLAIMETMDDLRAQWGLKYPGE